mmetsp:Transcript_44041/g.64625  ORF Transcript_44041/g.64625 Transcript_44041/m.64625 type:complete len:209 (-) Transcript_44041:725-1351(-)
MPLGAWTSEARVSSICSSISCVCSNCACLRFRQDGLSLARLSTLWRCSSVSTPVQNRTCLFENDSSTCAKIRDLDPQKQRQHWRHIKRLAEALVAMMKTMLNLSMSFEGSATQIFSPFELRGSRACIQPAPGRGKRADTGFMPDTLSGCGFGSTCKRADTGLVPDTVPSCGFALTFFFPSVFPSSLSFLGTSFPLIFSRQTERSNILS